MVQYFISGNERNLTLYPKIQIFNDPEGEAFRKNFGKRRKPAFSPFPTMFSVLLKPNFNSCVTFILSSANAVNLDMSKI